MVMVDIPKERDNQGGAAGAWHVWNASGPQCLSLRVLCVSMPPADESGSSVAGSAAKGDGTSDAAVDERGSSSSSAWAFAAGSSGGGGSVDGDERQLPCGGGGGSGNPLNCDDVATGEHSLLPVDAKGGSVALGGSSSMGMADKINASSESTTITTAASNICRRGTRSSSGPALLTGLAMTSPGEPARDGGLDEGGRKALTMTDLRSPTGTPSGVSTTSLGDEIKASSESSNITAAASTINAPGPAERSDNSVAQCGRRMKTDDAGSAVDDAGSAFYESGISLFSAGALAASTSGGCGSRNPLNSDEHSNRPKTDVAAGEHGLLPDEAAPAARHGSGGGDGRVLQPEGAAGA